MIGAIADDKKKQEANNLFKIIKGSRFQRIGSF